MEQRIETSLQTFGRGASNNRQIRRSQYKNEPRRPFRSNPNFKPRYPTRQFQRRHKRPQMQHYSRNNVQKRTDDYAKSQRNYNDYTYPARRSFGNPRYPYRENSQRNPNWETRYHENDYHGTTNQNKGSYQKQEIYNNGQRQGNYRANRNNINNMEDKKIR